MLRTIQLSVLLIALCGCDTFHMARIDYSGSVRRTVDEIKLDMKGFGASRGWSCREEQGNYTCGPGWHTNIQLNSEDGIFYIETLMAHPGWCSSDHFCNYLNDINEFFIAKYGSGHVVIRDNYESCIIQSL